MNGRGAALSVADAMALAVEASEAARGISSPNPPVGAVILDADGIVVGIGSTRPPGGPHAEIVALAEAGDRARGGTAVVTLEPCNHTGRTGPCSQALIAAGIAAVVHAVADPNPLASGGGAALRAAGIRVEQGTGETEVRQGPLRAWLHKQRTGRPHVTWKYAATLDGRSAAADGTSQWITGPQSRAHVHAERAKLDAIVVGTGTVLADDPRLTARRPDGTLAPHQPVRVVVGSRPIPSTAAIRGSDAPTVFLDTHDPAAVIDALHEHTDIQLEGGPTLAGAFLAAGLVDRVVAYVAPAVLGSGPAAVENAGIGTIADAIRFRTETVTMIGNDILIGVVPEGAK
ncbi:bifunctional diaminohydroxyphosphoribosylaminopyrimidine deaminase/5-amino-6-(5-phosphoribosylamino)uracil reductase RibD [Rhodococcus sp. IEGM 1370]|jgi:diaminohydroxyphosphoribosylaminopyrimidine deaminase/5-amino-6-(5-phosphoribosylamino)uracil reductase|uniref:Riboflavin biosynthesis protein RibD n=1 Tax=Rhodococcus cercidiphylli TaxID=489916 RepID=A0ABU4ATG9_9NOCA|nr:MULTISPECIES: bifunctional diaminohydroxyphosphoribosylaminopyrimidine deaminase/5-amino-6-(5-phosphoribosylamino)uracil reductase RibD [Rhodococcus]KAA0926488.1 bifunctional diaminohydroxyphosphoribosylaminopyrimidine deaminase/5-amino-6-(5-phosphoribosylamino)uracil reductase RibD [Rhodococcus sp. ANT_H53B]MDV6229518.1 bifunctional diaminohydroxyphosphoribosylaminopyrimidine deaminase/5-amino-6-(5-phosphoribosylamino)uracil reductase RibD [Rhodococcus cercidiphylli]MDV8076869.1 bifunctional